MPRIRNPKPAGIPASSLNVAEPHELESYGADNPLKRAADAISIIADAVNEATAEATDEAAPSKDQHVEAEERLADGEARRLKFDEDQKVESSGNQVPAWATIPETGADGQPFRFPKGRKILFLRFRAHLTDVPGRGERQAILWPLSTGDVRFAADRSHGSAVRAADEFVKQCIRAIDGKPVDWTTGGAANNPDQFWAELGQGYRVQLQRIASQINTLNAKEVRDFLENCVALVIPG